MTRLTYKSIMGDYGSVMEYPSKNDEIQALRNRLEKYEDFEIPLENLKWISLLGNSCYVVRADVIIKCHVLAVKFDEFHRIYYYIAGNYKIDEENTIPFQEWTNEQLFVDEKTARLYRGLVQNKEQR